MDAPSLEPARLLLRVSADMSVSPDDADEPVEYEADVVLLDEDFEETEADPIAHLAYRVVPCFLEPDEDNEDAIMVMDGLDAAALEIAEVLQENLNEAAPDGTFGLLIFDDVWVHPDYRGQGVASHAIWRVLKLFEGAAMPDHAVALVRAYDQDSLDEDTEPVEDEERHERVVALFERMGFKRVGDSGVVIVPLEKEPRAPSTAAFVVRR